MTAFAAFIGFVLPPFIDMVNRNIKNSDIRFWVSVLACVFIGAIYATVMSGGFAGHSIQAIIELIAAESLTMFGVAQLSYKVAWEKSEVRTSLNLEGGSAK